MNRNLENRETKAPQLSDKRECGQLEQDAALVLMPHSPHLYNEDTRHNTDVEYRTLNGNMPEKKEFLEIHIAKARYGRRGMVPLRYIPKYHYFEDIEIIGRRYGHNTSNEHNG